MIADDYAAIAKALTTLDELRQAGQKALHPAPDGLRAAGDAKPEPKVDVMEPLFVPLEGYGNLYAAYQAMKAVTTFVPHDPVVPPCDSGE